MRANRNPGATATGVVWATAALANPRQRSVIIVCLVSIGFSPSRRGAHVGPGSLFRWLPEVIHRSALYRGSARRDISLGSATGPTE